MGFSTNVVVECGCGTEWTGLFAYGLVCYRQETVIMVLLLVEVSALSK